MNQNNPFPGLRPFNPNESSIFFGRTSKVDDLLVSLAKSRFTAVVGTSGSGKSSLVGAGLLAALRRGLMADVGSQWRIAHFRPGNSPIQNLARELHKLKASNEELVAAVEATLRRSSFGLLEAIRQLGLKPGENVLIVVDQFEELFRYRPTFNVENPSDEAASFVKLLLVATQRHELPVYVVLTMRSEYLGESAQFSGLPEAINVGQYLIPRMNDDERREAITIPVAFSGAKITAPLVNRLMNDAGDDPDKLPLLQHALMRTWGEWKRLNDNGEKPIDISHYLAIGTLNGSLSKHANEALAELSADQQKLAERVFRALATKGLDNRGIRTPRRFKDLRAIITTPDVNARTLDRDVRAVIDAYRRDGRSFLTPTPDVEIEDDTLIDISHESLIQGWDKLQLWVKDEADSARTYKRLVEHAVLYDDGREKLLTEPALPFLIEWYHKKQKPNEAWARSYFEPMWKERFKEGGAKESKYENEYQRAVAFLDESQKVYEQDLAAKQRASKRRVKVLRTAAAAFGLLFLVAAALAGVATRQANKASKAQQEALSLQQIAIKERAKVEHQLAQITAAQEEIVKQSKLAEAAQISAVKAQAEAVEQAKAAQVSKDVAIKSKEEAEVEKGRAEKASEDAETNARLAEEARAKAEAALEVAKAAEAKAEREREKAERALILVEEQKKAAIAALEKEAEQRARAERALNVADNTLVTLRNADNQTPAINAISRQDSSISTAQFDLTGNRALISGQNTFLLELRTGAPQFTKADLRNVARLSTKLMSSSNVSDHLFGLLSLDAQMLLQEQRPAGQPTDQLIDTLVNEFNQLLTLRSLYDPKEFSNVRLRRETQDLLNQRPAGGDELMRLNRMLLEDAFPLEIAQFGKFNLKHDFSPGHIAFVMSPDGELVTGKYDDTQIDLFDSKGTELQSKGCDCHISTVGISRNKSYIWSKARDSFDMGYDHALLVWRVDQKTDTDPTYKIDLKRPISQAVLSPDEQRFALTFPLSKEIQIWDLLEGKKILSLAGTEQLPANTNKTDNDKDSLVNTLSFSDDGQFIVGTFKNSKDVRVWDAKTGRLRHTLRGHRCHVNSAEFSRNGQRVVAAGDDGSAIVWDLKKGKKFELRGYRGLLIYGSRGGIHQIFPYPRLFHFDLKPKEGEFIPLNSAKFDSTGEKVVTTSVDGKVRVWVVKDSHLAANRSLLLQGYTGNVRSAEFSPDDKFVIAAGEDGVSRIWNIGNGQPPEESRPKSCDDANKIKQRARR